MMIDQLGNPRQAQNQRPAARQTDPVLVHMHELKRDPRATQQAQRFGVQACVLRQNIDGKRPLFQVSQQAAAHKIEQDLRIHKPRHHLENGFAFFARQACENGQP